MSRKALFSILSTSLIACGYLALGEGSARAAGSCSGHYVVQCKSANVGGSFGVALPPPAQSFGASFQSPSVPLDEDCHVPEGLFDNDVVAAQAAVDGLAFLTSAQKASWKVGVEDAYDDLRARIDGSLERMPDRIVLTPLSGLDWFGNQWVGITLIDDDHPESPPVWRQVYTNPASCNALVSGTGPAAGTLGDGYGAGALVYWGFNAAPKAGHGDATVGVAGLSLVEDAFIAGFEMHLSAAVDIVPAP